MKLNRFNIKVTIIAVLLSFTGFMAFRSLFEKHLVITYISWIIAWISLLIFLIRTLNRTNRRLTAFLQSLPYLDNLNSNPEDDESFAELNLTFNHIIDILKNERQDKEVRDLYFKNTVEHISIGLIISNQKGDIRMMNRAAQKLLAVHRLTSTDGLDNVKTGLKREVNELKPGNTLLKSLVIDDGLKRIAIKKTILQLPDERLDIISMEDIRAQLEEEETLTWQKLIKVLRHEIMNSAAPINSLSNSLKSLSEKIRNDINPEMADLLQEGLDAISARSMGMMEFIEAYRDLTNIPDPVFSEFPLSRLLEEIRNLYLNSLKEKSVSLEISVSKDQKIVADYNLLSQLIINLVKNAIQAVPEGTGRISITAGKTGSGINFIRITDNGHGIPEELMDKIFIPFFTTREDGSGIGLSLARQIMHIHKGSIRAESKENETIFEILI